MLALWPACSRPCLACPGRATALHHGSSGQLHAACPGRGPRPQGSLPEAAHVVLPSRPRPAAPLLVSRLLRLLRLPRSRGGRSPICRWCSGLPCKPAAGGVGSSAGLMLPRSCSCASIPGPRLWRSWWRRGCRACDRRRRSVRALYPALGRRLAVLGRTLCTLSGGAVAPARRLDPCGSLLGGLCGAGSAGGSRHAALRLCRRLPG